MTGFLIKRLLPAGANPEEAAIRKRCGTVSGMIGIGLNLLLCMGKLAAGLLTGAISVMADAFNNLTDAASSVMTMIGFRLAGQKPDDDHPFGHGRAEYLTGLIVAILILLVGFELGKSSIEKILHPDDVEFELLTAVILLASIAIKLWMFLFNRALAGRLSSAALAATSTDSLTDAVATGVVFLGLLVSRFTGVYIDGWLGVAVAIFILRAGLASIKDTLDPLLGQAPDPALVKSVQETVLSHSEIVGMHDLIIHDYGPGRRMLSLHAEVPANADIMEAHDVIDHIERELREKFAVEAVIHMDPIVVGDEVTDRLRELVTFHAQQIDPSITIHDFRVTNGPLHTNLIFDMAVPHSCKSTNDVILEQMSQAMKAEDERYFTVVEIDRSYIH